MNLRVIRPVTVKVIVTDALKERLGYELRSALQNVELELERLLLTSDADGEPATARRRTRDDLRRRIKAVADLEIGSEQFHSTAESLLEIAVGDSWPELSACEVILRDGKVVAIR